MENFGSIEKFKELDIYETEDDYRLVGKTREFLDSLDEEALRDIFKRELEAAGVDDALERVDERFVPFYAVKIDEHNEGKILGTYSSLDGIELNTKPIIEGAKVAALFSQSDSLNKILTLQEAWFDVHISDSGRFTVNSLKGSGTLESHLHQMASINAEIKRIKTSRIMNDELMKMIFLKIETIHTLIHEELHALSTDEKFTTSDSGQLESGITLNGRKGSGVKESAYIMTTYPGSLNTKFNENYRRFTGLNEGITELHARRISQEYIFQILPKEILGTDIKSFYNLLEIGSYNRERWVAEQLVALFSVIAEVPSDIVERSLFRSYLSDGDFLPEELIAAVRHDVPELSREYVEQMLLKLQVAISADSFANGADADINRIFVEFADMLPPDKRNQVKDTFQELFYKYNFSKELQDEVVEK